jgi:hypothetical protein
MTVDIDFKRILDELLLNQVTRLEFDTEKENNIVIPVLSHFKEPRVAVLNLKFFDDHNVVYYEYENKPKYYYISDYRGYKIVIWEDFPTPKGFTPTDENIKKELEKYISLTIPYHNKLHFSSLTAYVKKKEK